MSSDFIEKSLAEPPNPETGALVVHEGLINLTAGRVSQIGGSLRYGMASKVDDTTRTSFRHSLPEPLPELVMKYRAKTQLHTLEEDIGESILHVRETLKEQEIARSSYEAKESERHVLPKALEGLSVPDKRHRRIRSQPNQLKSLVPVDRSSKATKTVDLIFQTTQEIKKTQNQILGLFEKEPLLNHRKPIHKVKKLFDLINQEEDNQLYLLGLVILLTSRQPEEMLSILSSDDLKAAIRRIETSTFKFFGDIRQSLKAQEDDHQLTGLQDGKIAYFNKLAYQIAKILLTSSGEINTQIIDSVISFFTAGPEHALNHEASLINGLLMIKRSELLRKKIEAMAERKPTPLTPLEIIRIQCGLAPHVQPSAQDAKITLLTALLSHPRQGQQGSCFASYLSIALLSSHKIKTTDDLLYILELGKLTRKTKRVKKDFPFMLRIGDGVLHKPFNINQKTWIVESGKAKLPVEKTPGLIAAARCLGLKHTKRAIREAALSLISHENETTQITCMQILKYLADKASSLVSVEERNPLHMLLKACYCFDAEVNNPLIRAFESCLADMAEASNEGMIKQPVMFSILDPLESFLNGQEGILEPEKNALVAEVQRQLMDRIHLSYDLDIRRDSSPDHNSLCIGGFALHDTQRANASDDWNLIDTPQKFKHFAESVLLSAQEIVEKGKMTRVLAEAAQYLKSDDFLKDALVSFYPEYEHKPTLLANWDSLPYTPWRILSGNIAPNVRDVYMGSEAQDDSFHQFKVSDPLSLMVLLMDLAKSIPVYSHLGYLDRKERKLPVFTDSHAFNLSFSHPAFRDIVVRNALPIKWIKDHYLKLAKALNEERLLPNEKEEMISRLIPRMKEAGLNDSWIRTLEAEPVANLRLVREICLSAELSDTSQMGIKSRERLIDQFIWNAMPIRFKTLFEKEAVPFADTNWNLGCHDILLCFAPQPGTDKIAIFEMKDTGEIIRYIRPGVLLNENLSIPKNPDAMLPAIDPIPL
ncbi:hypothetical protein [Estrella lausannensis]|uniref:Uncharacterized protein n=1 Tax=Estrella lausannensis TaxID=483423 RepID=A0A0H5DR08_9BACT|nr:hypothetical protein [Estrella lausannensis]CRX38064.1 hypothetical protein ELAC_0712 [Estrella lausannensis]